MVRAAELELAVLFLIEVKEIKALKKLICEFSEAQTVASLAVEAFLNAVFCHHVVDGDVFADFACEIKECHIFSPVIVVDQFCAVGNI